MLICDLANRMRDIEAREALNLDNRGGGGWGKVSPNSWKRENKKNKLKKKIKLFCLEDDSVASTGGLRGEINFVTIFPKYIQSRTKY